MNCNPDCNPAITDLLIPPILHARLGAGLRLEQSELTPAFLTTLKHAASMPNPLFYERQRLRIATWGVPRFLQSFDETIDGGLILPRKLADKVTSLAERAGSHLEVTDNRDHGTARQFTFTASLTREQQQAADSVSRPRPPISKATAPSAALPSHQPRTPGRWEAARLTL